MGNEYLIPANSKKSMLILSFFTTFDIILFSTGIAITFLLMIAIRGPSLTGIIFILLPALISAFLVLPVPNHHNIRVLIKNIYGYLANRRTYYWKGWCVSDVFKD